MVHSPAYARGHINCGERCPLLTFTNDCRIFLSDENPQVLAFEALENAYTKNDNVMFVVAPPDRQVFTREPLKAIDWLVEQAWQTPYSNRLDSLSNYQYTLKLKKMTCWCGICMKAQITLIILLCPLCARLRTAEPSLYKRLLAEEGSVTVVNVTVQLPRVDPISETQEVVEVCAQSGRKAESPFPAVDVRLGGMLMLNNPFSECF